MTDKRVRLMAEIISAIQLIKLNCWESAFANDVDVVRKEEINTIKWSSFLRANNQTIFFVSAHAMLFASFVTFVLMGGDLNAETVFVTMSLFNVLREPVTYNFPLAIAMLAETMVTCRRMERVLLLDEKQVAEATSITTGGISMNNYCAKWNKVRIVSSTCIDARVC